MPGTQQMISNYVFPEWMNEGTEQSKEMYVEDSQPLDTPTQVMGIMLRSM